MPPYKEQGVVLRSLQAGRGRQDRHGDDPGLRQGPGRGQGHPQDHQPVRRAAGAVHPRVADALPGQGLARHHHAGRDHRAASAPSGTDLALFAAGETMLEAVDKVAEEHERNIRLFTLLLLSGLRALEPGPVDPSAVAESFLLKLLSLSGFHPSLTACAVCGATGPDSCSRPARAAPCARAAPSTAPARSRSRRARVPLRLAHVDLAEAGSCGEPERPRPRGGSRPAVRLRRVPPRASDEVAADAREDRAP